MDKKLGFSMASEKKQCKVMSYEMVRYEIFGYELTWNGSKFT